MPIGNPTSQGYVMIITLWVITLLSIMAYALIEHTDLSVRLALRQEERAETDALLLLLTRLACAQVAQDTDLDTDHLRESWAARTSRSAEEILSGFEGADPTSGAYVVALTPGLETAKVSINLASATLLESVLKESGVQDSAKEIALAIADWRDPDDSGAAEATYYDGLPRPYRPANDDFMNISELLFVKGITPALHYGEDANGNGLLDPNEDDGDETSPLDNADGRLQPGLRDLFTVHGDGTINVNGVRESVLRAMVASHLGDSALTETVLHATLSRRLGPDGLDGTDDDHPFLTFDEVLSEINASLGGEQLPLAEAIARSLGVTTDFFHFRMEVRYPERGTATTAELILSREDDTLKITEWRES